MNGKRGNLACEIGIGSADRQNSKEKIGDRDRYTNAGSVIMVMPYKIILNVLFSYAHVIKLFSQHLYEFLLLCTVLSCTSGREI